MREQDTRTIEIEAVDDLDDDTLKRFLLFIYSGDYDVPNPCVAPSSSDLDQVVVEVAPSDCPSAEDKQGQKSCTSGTVSRNRDLDTDPVATDWVEQWEPEPEAKANVAKGSVPSLSQDYSQPSQVATTRADLWSSFCSSARPPKPKSRQLPKENL